MKTITTTNNVTPSTPNPKQPQPRQTAKEVIAANVKELIAQLEAGRSDALTAYLDAMSRFHNYSVGNVLEIARQRPDAILLILKLALFDKRDAQLVPAAGSCVE